MKFNEIFTEFEKGIPIRRQKWPKYKRITNNGQLSLCNFDYSADDWEIYKEPTYDEFLEEMKRFIYDDLNFGISSQSRHYDEANMNIFDVWYIIEQNYLNEENIRAILKYIKDNNLINTKE